jgi:hypothetical protein
LKTGWFDSIDRLIQRGSQGQIANAFNCKLQIKSYAYPIFISHSVPSAMAMCDHLAGFELVTRCETSSWSAAIAKNRNFTAVKR